jgi:hypothetical protein
MHMLPTHTPLHGGSFFDPQPCHSHTPSFTIPEHPPLHISSIAVPCGSKHAVSPLQHQPPRHVPTSSPHEAPSRFAFDLMHVPVSHMSDVHGLASSQSQSSMHSGVGIADPELVTDAPGELSMLSIAHAANNNAIAAVAFLIVRDLRREMYGREHCLVKIVRAFLEPSGSA